MSVHTKGVAHGRCEGLFYCAECHTFKDEGHFRAWAGESPFMVVVSWEDGKVFKDECETLIQAQRGAARLSRSKERRTVEGLGCVAEVFVDGQLYATWHNGKQERARRAGA